MKNRIVSFIAAVVMALSLFSVTTPTPAYAGGDCYRAAETVKSLQDRDGRNGTILIKTGLSWKVCQNYQRVVKATSVVNPSQNKCRGVITITQNPDQIANIDPGAGRRFCENGESEKHVWKFPNNRDSRIYSNTALHKKWFNVDIVLSKRGGGYETYNSASIKVGT